MNINDPILIPMQKFIKPLNINGLNGRMLRLKATKPKRKSNRHILMIYGHHSNLERMFGVSEVLQDFGTVTVPDLPGFGGMDSFYKIGLKPNMDNMADYLATFIKLRYKGKKITIVGMSLGFAIVTRMLQRYPDIAKKTDLLISIVGFTHKQDFVLSKKRISFYRNAGRFFAHKLTSSFFYHVALNPSLLRFAYSKTHNAKNKFEKLSEFDNKSATEFEIKLWRENDVRTYMRMTTGMMNLDNCGQQIDLDVHHISVDKDRYFDFQVVEQHMRVIFNDFTEHRAFLDNHAPSILATKEDASPLVPDSIKKILRKKTK